VEQYDVHRWVRSFLEALEGVPSAPPSCRWSDARATEEAVARISAAAEVELLLDYDGTLSPFTRRPEFAAPDAELRQLLERLAQRPGRRVHILSGRTRGDVERWFGSLPVSLCAEHGLWLRPRGEEWALLTEPDTAWKAQVVEIMLHVVTRTAGSFIEDKTASVAWHYRDADPEFGWLQANELRLHLMGALSNLPVAVLQGDKVVEVRAQGVQKGAAVRRILEAAPGALAVAMGDDRTDEDMFAALPPDGISVHVGPNPSVARYRLSTPRAARGFLERLL
jgi:trehalose 6-phosphate synthase/phosphatase